MANIMSMKQIKNKPSRNGFDLSFKKNFTAKAGELLPVMVREVIPGDQFNIDLKSFTRTQPVNTAAFARIREYYDFYYVPYHLLWNKANEVLSQMDYNLQHAQSLTDPMTAFVGQLPYVTTTQIVTYLKSLKNGSSQKSNFFGYDRATLSCKLLEYLGYGSYDKCLDSDSVSPRYNVDMNIMGLLAYQKIYADWYRDQQWEKPNPSTFNCDYMTGSGSMNVDLASAQSYMSAEYNMFDLRYCNWQKDMYHGVLPAAQYGDTAVVPIGSSSLNVSTLSDQDGSTLVATNLQSGDAFSYIQAQDAGGDQGKALSIPLSKRYSLVYGDNIVTGVSLANSNSGLSILALRQYEFLQKWKEIAQCGDQDYKGITKRIWNVDVPAGLSDKCQWIGGLSSSMDINEVVNTNITPSTPAEIAGKGIGVANGKLNFKSDGQYGVLMCIYHCMPLVDYTVDYLNPEFLRVNAEDFANPVFDRVGMQQVPTVSILQQQITSSDPVSTAIPQFFGYAPRYIDYKTAIDLSVGAFKGDMSHWVISYNQSDILASLYTNGMVGPTDIPSDGEKPADQNFVNYTFFKVNPASLDPIFATSADSGVDSTVSTDQFLCSAYFDVKAVRNLDYDGLPY